MFAQWISGKKTLYFSHLPLNKRGQRVAPLNFDLNCQKLSFFYRNCLERLRSSYRGNIDAVVLTLILQLK